MAWLESKCSSRGRATCFIYWREFGAAALRGISRRGYAGGLVPLLQDWLVVKVSPTRLWAGSISYKMLPFSPLAQNSLDAIQKAMPPGATHFEFRQAVLNLTKLMPFNSALGRALLKEDVWPNAARDQCLKALSGDPQYAYIQHVGSGGFQMDYFLNWVEKAATAEGTAEIGERHIAKALVGEDGNNLRNIGINGKALLKEVTRMETTAAAPPRGKPTFRAVESRVRALSGLDLTAGS